MFGARQLLIDSQQYAAQAQQYAAQAQQYALEPAAQQFAAIAQQCAALTQQSATQAQQYVAQQQAAHQSATQPYAVLAQQCAALTQQSATLAQQCAALAQQCNTQAQQCDTQAQQCAANALLISQALLTAQLGGMSFAESFAKTKKWKKKKKTVKSREEEEEEYEGTIEYIYNPLIYAINMHTYYVNTFFGLKKVLFVGMNPGPYGMAQNGVPFGDGQYVRDWMGIQGGLVEPYPDPQHPNHPILGLGCTKSEGSGSRFWEYMMKGPRIEGSGSREGEFKTMKDFFRHAYVHNYCPLLFLSPDGKNVTLDKLAISDRKALEMYCDECLLSCINIMKPEVVVAIGVYAEQKVNKVLKNAVLPGGMNAGLAGRIEVVRMLHPSTATRTSYNRFQTKVSEQLVNVLPCMKQPPCYQLL